LNLVALASLVKHLYKIVLVHQNAMMMARFLVAGATHQVAVIGLWVTDTGTIAGYKRIVTQAIAEQLTTSAQIQQMGQLHVLAATVELHATLATLNLVALASLVKHLYKIVLVHQNAMMMARFFGSWCYTSSCGDWTLGYGYWDYCGIQTDSDTSNCEAVDNKCPDPTNGAATCSSGDLLRQVGG
jgi:hypothetical protein